MGQGTGFKRRHPAGIAPPFVPTIPHGLAGLDDVGLTVLAGRLAPLALPRNLSLGKAKHNADQADEAAEERQDNLNGYRRIKSADPGQYRYGHNDGKEPTQSLEQHILPPYYMIRKMG
jgi:hypothetical protein